MRLHFNSVQLKHFLSFEDASVTFDSKGYTLICGQNENPDDNAKSNGSGKSALLESIVWALTGETVRGTKDVVNMYLGGTAEVTLDFSVDNTNYQILRTKDPSNLKFYVDGVDKSAKGIRDTEKLLQDYFPDLTSQLIGSVIVLGQGLPQRFTNNSPAGRKEVLEKLFKTDFMISDIKDRISFRDSKLKTLVRECEDSILELTSKKQIYQTQLEQANKELDFYTNTDMSYIQNSIAEYKNQIEILTSQVDYQTLELDKLNQELNEGVSNLSQLTSQFNFDLDNFNKKHLIEDNSFKDTLAETQANIKSLQSEITRLKNIKDVCPTCGQKLIGVEKPDTTKQEDDLCDLQEQYNRCQEDYNQFRERLEEEKKSIENSYMTQLNDLKKSNSSNQAQIEVINRNIVALNQEISSYDRKINEAQVLIDNFNNKVKSLNDLINEHTSEIEKFDEDILYNNNEKDRLKSHQDVITKMNTFSTRDFRGYLLSDIITQIDKRIKTYCQIVFGNTLLDFELNGNNLDVKFDGKDYQNLSGGEKQKIDVVIQFAIRDCLCKNVNFSSNILIMDEIFDNLDIDGCEKILALISHELTDVENIFIITHHSDISIPADTTITITKGLDKISRII